MTAGNIILYLDTFYLQFALPVWLKTKYLNLFWEIAGHFLIVPAT